MEETEHGPLSLQFLQYTGGADRLGNFHLYLAQLLQIIAIHPDLEMSSPETNDCFGFATRSIEIKQ